MHSGRAEESGHEVVDGATTDASLSTADPSHVHVGLRRAADGAFRASRSLDARPLCRLSVSAAAAAARSLRQWGAVIRRPGGTRHSGGRRLVGHRHRQITAMSISIRYAQTALPRHRAMTVRLQCITY